MRATLTTLASLKYGIRAGSARLVMKNLKLWVYFDMPNVPYDMCTCHKEECDAPVATRCGVRLNTPDGNEWHGALTTPYTCAQGACWNNRNSNRATGIV